MRVAASPSGPAQDVAASPAHGGAVWYLTSTAVGFAIPLLTLPVITRALPPEEYGAWVLAYAYGVLIGALSNFGMSVIYERSFFEAKEAGENAALLWTTVAFVSALLAIALLATWVWRDTLSGWVMHSSGHTTLLFWTACAVGVANLKTYFLIYLRNRGEARRFALFSIDEMVLGAAASVLLVAWWQVGPLGLAWGPLGASLIVLAILTLHFLRRVPVRFAASPLMASLRLGFPLLPRVFLAIFGQIFDKWLVGLVAAAGGVAAYAIGQRLAFVVFAVATSLENVFQPRTYRSMFDGGVAAGKEIGRMLTPFAYATVGVAVVVGLGTEEAIWVLAPQSYAGAAAVTNVLVMHFAFTFFGKQPQLLYAKKIGLLSLLSSLSVLLNAAAMWFFATHYGAVGAAVGTLIAGVLTTSLTVSVSQRHYRIEYERAKLLLIYTYFVCGLAATCLLQAAELAYPLRVAVKVVIVAGYGSIGAVFGWWTILLRHARWAQ